MVARIVRVFSVLIFSCALISCLPDRNRDGSRKLAWSLFESVCLGHISDHVSIIRHASAKSWQPVPDGEEFDPPQRLTRGPNRSWRIDQDGMTVFLGIEILGDAAMAERMLEGGEAGNGGMLFCNVHFDGGNAETITEDISSISIEQAALGRAGIQMGARNGRLNRIWGIGRGRWQALNFTFDPEGNSRFIEVSVDIQK